MDRDGLVVEVVRIADAVQAGNGRYDDDIPPSRHQRRGGAHAEFVDFVIDTQVFLYIGVRRRDIGFRLIIVVVGYEVFHRVVREESLEFTIQLGGERLVVAQDESGPLKALDDVRHRESFTRSGHPEKGHILHPFRQCFT